MQKLCPSLQHLVKILNDLQVHSDHTLSQTLNISHKAVWKYINQLHTYGIEIQSFQSSSYCLKHPLYLLNKAEIQEYLTDPTVEFTLLGSIPSTNDHFKNRPLLKNLEFCLAEHQTLGRGRFGRSWVAPFGANILLSCRFLISKDLSRLGGLSLCVGLALIKTLQFFGLKEITCKWPNDLLYRNQKLAGVLIEVQTKENGTTEAIIGVGLNVNMPAAVLAKIERPFSSLEKILGTPQDRNKVAALLMNNLCEYLRRFQERGFADFQEEWKVHDALCGQEILLHIGTDFIKGTGAGIDSLGRLLLKLPSNEIQAYSAGEASLSKRDVT